MTRDKSIPWCEPRSNGTYYAWWYDTKTKHTRRQSLDTKDSVQAAAAFAKWLVKFTQTSHISEPAGGMTVTAALDDYAKEHVDLAIVDPGRHHIAIRWLREFFGPRQIEALTPDDVTEFCRQRATGKIGNPARSGTQRRDLAVLNAAINHQVKRRRLPAGCVPYLGHLPAAGEPRDRWLTHDELERLFEACQKITERGAIGDRMTRAYRFATLAYYTASRRRAIESLTWFQVDLVNQKIDLNFKGRKQTSKRRPIVPISPALMPILQTIHAQKINEFVLDHGGDARVPLQRAAKLAGIEGFHPHVLRHTRAVHLAQDGADIYQIAGILGDTIKTVEKSYLHHCPNHLREAMKSDQPAHPYPKISLVLPLAG